VIRKNTQRIFILRLWTRAPRGLRSEFVSAIGLLLARSTLIGRRRDVNIPSWRSNIIGTTVFARSSSLCGRHNFGSLLSLLLAREGSTPWSDNEELEEIETVKDCVPCCAAKTIPERAHREIGHAILPAIMTATAHSKDNVYDRTDRQFARCFPPQRHRNGNCCQRRR
jgi:hypothetical protein